MAVLELEQVGVRYGEVVALDQVEIVIGRGEVVAVLGANGAGKSTLFDVLLGLLRPGDGTVRVFGRAPGGALRSRVGAMLQNAGLPGQVSVAELVRLVGRSYPSSLSVDEVLDRVGLSRKRDRTVEVLSGGERQRLLLAMALVGEPELLVLDEPTAAMDVDARRGFWERTRASVGEGVTLVFATHDLAEADAVADRVLVLQRGRLIADASPAVLKRQVSRVMVTVSTDAPHEVVAAWDGVDRVEEPLDAAVVDGLWKLHVWANAAENVVVPMAQAGFRMRGLSVDEADLEEAFAELTATTAGPGSPAATQGAA
ncbi:ABC transporter ATP-binding protein [Egibacter rhizosphaerae]|uniref:ABC transporter ATP-binding protein n=1 Tax=Egibacter rhizosphaerae TaxID=1670831 RepID=A0A411YBQ6_9ACTN|nr:ABC transporter ATP-binding protein [Egibacter rhizosphaerae]QBI18587.1 ABC transporter ATP-binding protein [Egibacter rhizosphaerae]